MIVLLFASMQPVLADISMPSIFTDNMVLQQQPDIPVWGKAEANEEIVVTTSWDTNPMKQPREAQMMTLHLAHTGMAVTIDNGDAADIHPKNKQEVGHRLALAARANTYGEKIDYSGPRYQDYRIEGDQIGVSFGFNKALKPADGKALTGFATVGPDHKFYWAEAIVEGNEVVVRSPKAKYPLAVRYGWANNPDCNLTDSSGLPASPFRTDQWRGVTK